VTRAALARRTAALLAAALPLGACRSAPATSAPAVSAAPAAAQTATAAAAPPSVRADTSASAHPADARFLEHMTAHHAQALAMTVLVPARTARPDLRALAERIALSQRDEIALMRRWLAAHGRPAPADPDGHAAHAADDHAAMPGMLTAAELSALAAARGAAFERLFLASMIRHHEGALAMVASYFATPGAAQDAAIFRLASDVDADQRAEIRRMRAMLDATAAGVPRR
jgi:uncharacterized protein (DUF305 family)